MNSKKITNSLISIFIIINILLFFVDNKMVKSEYELSSDRRNKLINTLANKNIHLKAQLPNRYKMRKLYLSAPLDRELELINKILDTNTREATYIEGVHQHTSGDESLIFYQAVEKGRIFYNATNPTYIAKSTSDKSINDLIEKFIDDFKVADEEYVITEKVVNDDHTIYFLNEVFEGEILYCNEIVIKIVGAGITDARMIRYTPIRFDDELNEIKPVDEVLYMLMFELGGVEPLVIENIDIGYSLGQDTSSGAYSFTVDPYYIVTMDNEERYYIDAFTGKLIK